MVRIKKCCAIPCFWDPKFQNVRGERSGVALIFPQIIAAEIREDEDGTNERDDCERPVLAKGGERVRSFHQSTIFHRLGC